MIRPAVLVTGASGFIGGAITERLVDRADVRSLTLHPEKNRFGPRVQSFAYDFANPARMADAFAGVEVFVNTYYVRFKHGSATFERAVEQSGALMRLAQAAGVRKIVHVSVSNADERSDLPYYRNKARIERNIAFFLRRLPVFAIFGRGAYRVQPITLDAFADVAVEAIDGEHSTKTVAVAGPSDWTFLAMVEAIRHAIGSHAALVRAPAWAALAGLKVAGLMLGDVVLTRDEIRGLTEEYLYAEAPLRRGIDFREWLMAPSVASTLGRAYASELGRHLRRA